MRTVRIVNFNGNPDGLPTVHCAVAPPAWYIDHLPGVLHAGEGAWVAWWVDRCHLATLATTGTPSTISRCIIGIAFIDTASSWCGGRCRCLGLGLGLSLGLACERMLGGERGKRRRRNPPLLVAVDDHVEGILVEVEGCP